MRSNSLQGMNQLKLHILQHSQSMNSITNYQDNWWVAFEIIGRFVAYSAAAALVVVVFFWIMKYLSEYNERNEEEEIRPTETSPLCDTNVAPLTYRTCEEDLEVGNCNSSDESDNELYNGRLCVICYDDERNCFFVPCGHCATCYDCAKRIFDGDPNKKCPVCRRLIGKVKRLLAP